MSSYGLLGLCLCLRLRLRTGLGFGRHLGHSPEANGAGDLIGLKSPYVRGRVDLVEVRYGRSATMGDGSISGTSQTSTNHSARQPRGTGSDRPQVYAE